jgi:hypothetical protein
VSNVDRQEVRSVNDLTGGEKGVKLARFDLIPSRPLTLLAEHFGLGAEKYADRNWERGYEWSKSYAALMRHVTAWWGGETLDEESGSNHLVSVAWHAFALLEWAETHPEMDDRPHVDVVTVEDAWNQAVIEYGTGGYVGKHRASVGGVWSGTISERRGIGRLKPWKETTWNESD